MNVAAPITLTAWLAASASDIDLLERAANLSGPALLVGFIWLTSTGRLVWRREIERERIETEAWRQAAIGRTLAAERGATIAEAALEQARRGTPAE